MQQVFLLQCLLDGRIDFVLVGGMAAVAYGSSQLTRDLDVCVPLDVQNFLRLQAALRPFNPRVRAGTDLIPLELDEAVAGGLKNLYVLTDEGNLDCLGEVAGIGGYAQALSLSVEIEVFGRTCHVLTLEALIKAKETMGRPRDLLAATELRAILERVRGNRPKNE